MRVLGLFSGIGGFELGLERAGCTIAAMCESEPFPRAVLAKHWPGVPCYDDVRTLTAETLARDGIALPDLVCGGFPCQDISLAGKGAGLGGERSGLWWEMHRIIDETRPAWVLAENVAALRSRGLDQVLGSLAAIGYDAEWNCIPASAVGAPHRRDRIWIVAYPNQHARHERRLGDAAEGARGRDADRGVVGADVAHPTRDVRAEQTAGGTERQRVGVGGKPAGRLAIAWPEHHQWLVEPNVGRVAHGVPARVDRLRALGNAVVPQIVETLGRAILAVGAPR